MPARRSLKAPILFGLSVISLLTLVIFVSIPVWWISGRMLASGSTTGSEKALLQLARGISVVATFASSFAIAVLMARYR